MKRLSVLIVVCCAMAGAGEVRGAADVTSSQKEAVAAYPDLARAGSPFHRKFMDLYAKAKASKAPALALPDWPMVLARETAAALAEGGADRHGTTPPPPTPPAPATMSPAPSTSGISTGPTVSDGTPPPPEPIKLQPLKLYVPCSEAPDFTAEGRTPEQIQAEWQKKKAHLLTLPAQIVDPAKASVPEEIPPVGPEPNLWRTLAQLYRARKEGNLDAAKALIVPEARKAIAFESKGKSAIERPPEVPLVVQIHGNTVVFLREGGTISPLTVLVRGGEYLVTEPQTWEPDDRRLLFDLTDFLQKQPASGLLAK